MKPIEMLICSGCGEYAGSHIDAVIGGLQSALSEAIARAERAEAENDDLKSSVIAFCSPWAVEHAKKLGLPARHLHPTHYDILARAGARMDDFIRADLTEAT